MSLMAQTTNKDTGISTRVLIGQTQSVPSIFLAFEGTHLDSYSCLDVPQEVSLKSSLKTKEKDYCFIMVMLSLPKILII